MNPTKVDRRNLKTLTDLPNVGKAMAADLQLLGIKQPDDLVGCNAFDLYRQLCDLTHVRHDPCVIDVFISITRFMEGEQARPWWEYTEERKMLSGSHNPN
ncbi:MAG: mitomycin resistance protein [Gammaproteobacteria bacterium]|nr:MAG: mitomycin resistance protein [Gammaproteobacteria bacterium]